MKLKKKILMLLLLAFAIIQFIRQEKNISAAPTGNEITAHFNVPDDIQSILKTSCYDCHSNNTHYPWYSWIQPVGWWLGGHIKNAKQKVNFDEFASYSPKKQHHQFEEMDETVSEKEMPLFAYRLIHRDASLSEDQIKLFVDWTKAMRSTLKTNFPAENLMEESTEADHDE